MTRISIAFLTAGDAKDKRTWSGTPYYSSSALQEYVGDVDFLGPYRPFWAFNIGRIKSLFTRILLKKKYDYTHSTALSKAYGKYFSEKLKLKKYDLIFACGASSELAFLDTQLPIIYLSDTTFARMLGYNPRFTGLTQSSTKQGMLIEQKAIDRANFIAYPSEWAKESAIIDYKANPDKIKVIPLGANFDNLPESPVSQETKKSSQNKNIRLLFLGVNWELKGGEIALNAFNHLIKNNIDAELVICGCVPPFEINNKSIQVIPFLNKNDQTQREQFMNLFYDTDFLIVPTRTDCFGIVFCEASGFGIPSLATNTGGVGGAIKEGVNGYLFDYNDDGIGYANKIIELMKSPERLEELKKSSRKMYEEKLNWKAWATGINNSNVVQKIKNSKS